MATKLTPLFPKGDVEATWEYIEAGLEKVMSNPRSAMDTKTWMGVYTAVHNFCTTQKAPARSSFAANNNRGVPYLLGEDLYRHLIEYLKTHLRGVQAKSREYVDETLLTFYINEWNRYTMAAAYNSRLFRFLERHWVEREKQEGHMDIYDIYTLHLVQWIEEISTDTRESVMRCVLRLVEKDRSGETIERSYVNSFFDSLASLDSDGSHSWEPTHDFYKGYFENPFIEATTDFYNRESRKFLAENGVVEYVRWVLARLDEEKERVTGHLRNQTMQRLMEACDEALITQHSSDFQDASLDAKDAEGRTPLSWAAEKGHMAMVKLLLENPNVRSDSSDYQSQAPLSWAAKNGHKAVVDLLIQDLNRKNSDSAIYGRALHAAVTAGRPEIIKTIFNDTKINIDFQDTETKSTALHLAVEKDDQHVYRALLGLGANMDLKNRNGLSALELAWSNKRITYDAYKYDKDRSWDLDTAGQAECKVLRRKSDALVSDQTSHEYIFCKKYNLMTRNKGQEKVMKDVRILLLREHNILQKLKHPNIVEFLGFEQREEMAELYLEYCNGGSLHPHVKGESTPDDPPTKLLDKAEVWELVFQLAAALAYLHHGLTIASDKFTFEAHWTRILHRDIKPENVVLNQSTDGHKVVKLCDLGLAKQANAALTRNRGTENYKPPEMRSSTEPQKEWTIKGEIYSLGRTLDNLGKTTDCKNELQPLIDKCMHDDPSLRPSSLEILQKAVPYVKYTLPGLVSSLRFLLGGNDGDYLLNAVLVLGGWLDDLDSWYLKSTRHRRWEILERLHVLCYEDGAVTVLDSKGTSLHLLVVLKRVDKIKQLLEIVENAEQSLKGVNKVKQWLMGMDKVEESAQLDERGFDALSQLDMQWRKSGWTPLHLAYQAQRCQEAVEIQELLEQAGANVELEDQHGLRPRDFKTAGPDEDSSWVRDNGDLLDQYLKMRTDVHH